MTGYKSKRAAAQDKLAQPAQEPASITYKEVANSMNELRKGTVEQRQIAAEMEYKRLYATPPQRKPLTDEQLADFLGDEYHTMTAEELRYFRLAEAAHGIKEKKT